MIIRSACRCPGYGRSANTPAAPAAEASLPHIWVHAHTQGKSQAWDSHFKECQPLLVQCPVYGWPQQMPPGAVPGPYPPGVPTAAPAYPPNPTAH